MEKKISVCEKKTWTEILEDVFKLLTFSIFESIKKIIVNQDKYN